MAEPRPGRRAPAGGVRPLACGLALAALLPAAAGAQMRAPAAVDPGEAVTLLLDAPAGPGTALVLRRHGDEGAPLSEWELAPGTGTHSFAAPRRAGSYRIVLERGGRVVEDAVLEVVAAPAAVELRAPAEAGAPLSIHVSGSADRGDRIELVDRHGAVLAQVRLGALEAGSARLRAPGASGHYRLVLRTGEAAPRWWRPASPSTCRAMPGSAPPVSWRRTRR